MNGQVTKHFPQMVPRRAKHHGQVTETILEVVLPSKNLHTVPITGAHYSTEAICGVTENISPSPAKVTRVELAKFKWEQLDHPPYNPDMSHCNFHVFSPLKKYRKGKRFNSDEKLKGVVSRHGRRNSSVRQLMGSLCLGLWCIL
ncbi:histone-lysine N-methyltransferase SETMAR [Trichonephila clavipes]|nr:histone-lysine N-methyltransferase SETMAR [Trichonephila clavipes]